MCGHASFDEAECGQLKPGVSHLANNNDIIPSIRPFCVRPSVHFFGPWVRFIDTCGAVRVGVNCVSIVYQLSLHCPGKTQNAEFYFLSLLYIVFRSYWTNCRGPRDGASVTTWWCGRSHTDNRRLSGTPFRKRIEREAIDRIAILGVRISSDNKKFKYLTVGKPYV